MRSNRLAALALAVTTVAFPVAISQAEVVSTSRHEISRQGSGVDKNDWQWRYRLVIVTGGTSSGPTSTYGSWSEWHFGPVKLPTIAQPRNGYAYFQVQKARAPTS